MRWNFIICLLFITAAVAKPRSKRSLGYIKSLISNKLFGSNTVTIAQPIPTNNDTYQLFKIPGRNDILIKVTTKDKAKPHKDEKPNKELDAAIVKPEVAIIGSYLGTTTQKETLLAIEMVNRLIESGVLSAGRNIQELVVPMIPEPPQLEYYEKNIQPLKVIAQEQDHIVVPVQVDNRNAFSMYPVEYSPYTVSSDVKLAPVQTKYSYKQTGPEADMTYELNNKDVIVTRTEKEPPLPQFIKLRMAEVATIGANPYGIRPLGLNGTPNPVQYYVNPSMLTHGNSKALPYLSHRIPKPHNGFVQALNRGSFMDGEKPVFISEPPVGIDSTYVSNTQVNRCKEKIVGKICPHSIASKEASPIQNQETSAKVTNEVIANDKTNIENNANANRLAVNEFLKNHSVNGQIVSQYVYKQINHHSHDNYTEVKVGDPQIKDIAEGNIKLRKDYVYIPPVNVGSSMALGVINKDTGNVRKNDEFKYSVPLIKTNVKLNADSFEQHPIVVTEEFPRENTKTNEGIEKKEKNFDKNERGDIPGATY